MKKEQPAQAPDAITLLQGLEQIISEARTDAARRLDVVFGQSDPHYPNFEDAKKQHLKVVKHLTHAQEIFKQKLGGKLKPLPAADLFSLVIQKVTANTVRYEAQFVVPLILVSILEGKLREIDVSLLVWKSTAGFKLPKMNEQWTKEFRDRDFHELVGVNTYKVTAIY